jgi:large subunit ribosomal protein L35
MPKMKSHRGTAKRVKRTAGGKLMRRRRGMNHILTKKNKKRKRHLRKATVVASVDEKRINQLLPGT